MNTRQVEALYRQYGPSVYRRALNILKSEAEAQEAMQDVFVSALTKGQSFKGQSSPTTWLYSVTTNLCLNRLRNRKRRGELMAEHAPVTALADRPHPELIHVVSEMLRSVPEEEARLAVYYYYDEMTQEEISGITGTPRRTVADLLERFRARIARREKSS
jgi:RNA polymerase sigma-70 factor (ECF subfamily)